MPNGYKIRGIEPPDLASYPAATRKLFWSWVVDAGLKRKDKELSEGLDKNGKPLRAISKETRKHRRSAMTPSGKGRPNAPPLTPGLQKSRTRSLLAGKATANYAEFWWRYDAWTGDSWSVVLSYQAKKGRNVFGLSPRGTAFVKRQAWAKWEQYKAGHVAPAEKQEAAAVKVPQVGNYDTTHATFFSGVSADTFKPGQWTGFMTQAQWAKYYRGSSSARVPGRPSNPPSRSRVVGPGYNRLLKLLWGQGSRPGRGGSAAPSTSRPGPRKPPSKVR